jgi:hypothetical protein
MESAYDPLCLKNAQHSCQMVIQGGWNNCLAYEPCVRGTCTLQPLCHCGMGIPCHFPGIVERVWAAKCHYPMDRLVMAAVA